MCGIVGYIGKRRAEEILTDGLEKLAYRGYDSSGIAVIDQAGSLCVRKKQGKLDKLKALLEAQPISGNIGIGHTRWATHGRPNDSNAHPLIDTSGRIAVVHNGIIENHDSLRSQLKEQGVLFQSDTDTEVIAHLLGRMYEGNMIRTLLDLQTVLQGSYAIAVICANEPEHIFCMKCGSPLVMGFHSGEGFLASDIPAVLGHVRDIMILQDNEIGTLSGTGMQVYDKHAKPVYRGFFHVNWDRVSTGKNGFAHYMLKEIHEQPSAFQNTFFPRNNLVQPDWMPFDKTTACLLKKVTIAACGTAYNAGMIAKYVFEMLAELSTEIEFASEYRYRSLTDSEDELFIAVSQSGETADTLAALQEARKKGRRVMAVCNAVDSAIAREAGEKNTLYTCAGPEIAVASTKAYLTQVELLIMIAAALGVIRQKISAQRAGQLQDALSLFPDKARQTLRLNSDIQQITSQLRECNHVFFIGRGMDYALSMEAALKLKEVSYLFSEAYAAGELKHGPIALLQPGSLVIATVTQWHVMEKMLANIQEVRARGAEVLAVCPSKMKQHIKEHVDKMVLIPDTDEILQPLLAAIPLQLFAYYMAVNRDCDVDQPRNLAKSVTVE